MSDNVHGQECRGLPSPLIKAFTQVLGQSNVVLGGDISERHNADWSLAPPVAPSVLLRPDSTEKLSQIVSLCNSYRQPIVVQGGMTGLAGGATPQRREVAISLELMSGVQDIDPVAMTLSALAGTPLQALQQAALQHSLVLPLDLAARGSCSIGGNLATNAGGTEVIRYGMTRSLVLGLEVVLADGTIVNSMNKMVKNNSGYDVKQLFIGSEGTLGIISRVVLQLQPQFLATHTALCALSDYDSVIEVLNALKRRLGGGLTGFEVMWANYYRRALEALPSVADPFRQQHPFYLLVEYKDNRAKESAEWFESELYHQIESGFLLDALVAKSQQDARIFWRIRDGISELLNLKGAVSNQDISLPINLIGDFSKALLKNLGENYEGIDVLFFGHIADNNLHAVVYANRVDDGEAIERDIMELIGEFGGAITAEHGVGVLKKDYLKLSRNDSEIALMRTLKQALDPVNILNRGRVI
ncbi:MAG: oxidoreductase [Cellvibrionales bacterium TMED49]|nr:MAG: oxidoreductase [Cellvibrionales bacterium TMED49]